MIGLLMPRGTGHMSRHFLSNTAPLSEEEADKVRWAFVNRRYELERMTRKTIADTLRAAPFYTTPRGTKPELINELLALEERQALKDASELKGKTYWESLFGERAQEIIRTSYQLDIFIDRGMEARLAINEFFQLKANRDLSEVLRYSISRFHDIMVMELALSMIRDACVVVKSRSYPYTEIGGIGPEAITRTKAYVERVLLKNEIQSGGDLFGMALSDIKRKAYATFYNGLWKS